MKFRENIHKTNDNVGWTFLCVIWLFIINNIVGLVYDHQPLFMYYIPVILVLIFTITIHMLNNISYETNNYD